MIKSATQTKSFSCTEKQQKLKIEHFIFSILKSAQFRIIFLILSLGVILVNAQTVVLNPTSPFTVPLGVTSVKVEVWGGGGGGGGAVGAFLNARGAGGGGGGAYKTSTLSVVGGQTYTITYGAGGSGGNTTPSNGANGTATTFTGIGGTVTANGGSGGLAANGANSNGGAGGTGGTFNGGAGGNSSGNGAGGGGGAGNNGAGGAGGNATTGAAGAGTPSAAPYIGGIGGAYRSGNGDGNNAGNPGGGGGGGRGASFFGVANGGNGGNGQVVLTYTLPPCVTPPVGGTASGPASGCVGSLQTFSITGGSGTTQWQSGPAAGGPFTDISGAVASTYNVTPGTSGTTYYRVKRQAAGCTDAFSNVVTNAVSNAPNTPTTPGSLSICPDAAGTISALATVSQSVTLTFTIASQPAETNSAPGNIIASVSMAALPVGSVVTGATLNLNNITALGNSWQSDVRLGLSGAIADAAASGTGTPNSAGNFNYTRSVSGVNVAGGTVNLLYWDYFNDNTGNEANFNAPTAATVVINYTTPASIRWYNAASGGTLQGTGSPFNPVGTSLLPNTSTSGTYNFYAEGFSGSCTSASRLVVPVVIKESPAVSANSNGPVCNGTLLSLSANNTAIGQSSGNTFQWSGPNLFTSSQQNPTVTSTAAAVNSGAYTVTITNQFLCTASGTTGVTVNPNPSVQITTQTNITCNGDGDGTVTVTGVGGTGPYLFFDGGNFLTDPSSVVFTGYTPGSYCFNVYDANGCDNTAASPVCTNVTEPAVLAFTTSKTDVNCTGDVTGTITVNATGGTSSYQYSFDNGSTFQSSNVTSGLAVGTYDIIVKDAHNCITASSPVSIAVLYTNSTAPTSVTTNDDNNEICSGGSITLTQTGGTLSNDPGATYKWYQGTCNGTFVGSGNSVTVSPTSNASYYVLADGICNVTACATASVAVTQAAPAQSVVMPISNLPSNACIGTLVNNINIAPVAAATQYIWDGPTGCSFNGIGNPYTSSAPGADITFGNPNGSGYYIGVQAANACGSTARKVQWVRGIVSVPATINGNNTACENTSDIYSTGAVTGATSYSWSITGNATVIGNGNSVTVNFGPGWNGGTLCVAAQTSCYTSATKCISISRSASVITQIIGNFNACPGQTETYSVAPVSGAATYQWTIPPGSTGTSTTNSINVTFGTGFTGGNISVSVISICGVQSPIKVKTINSGVPPVPSSITGPLTGLCQQTIVYSCPSQQGATYNWTVPSSAIVNSGQGTNAISMTYGTFNTSTVCVTASNACGSSASRCITVTGRPSTPGAITSIPGSWCANTAGVEFDVDVSLLTGSYSLSWLYPSPSVATYVLGGGNSTSLILNWGNGSGQIQVTASNACGGQTRTSIKGNSCRDFDEDVKSVKQDNINVYPNPASNVLNIDLVSSNNTSQEIILTDVSGRVVMSKIIDGVEETMHLSLDVSKLAKGLYMLHTKEGDTTKIKVVIN